VKRRKGEFDFRLVIVTLCGIVLSACGANESVLKSGKDNSAQTNAAPRQQTFANELEEFRTADFRYIYVLRRKDGGEIDTEDKSVIKLNTEGANRRVSADGGKAFIIGTNTPISARNMAEIFKHFDVENYSSEVEPSANLPAH
jgi:hypothetical protein